jgi:hypothetical protein
MSERRRELLSTAFDRVDGQWVWFPNAWSRGIMVTAEERELYLTFAPVAFRQAIKGRPPTRPRRPYWATLGRILTAMASGRDPHGSE